MPGDSIDLDLPLNTPPSRAAFRVARPLLQWVLRLDTLRELHATAQARRTDAVDGAPQDGSAFATTALGVLDVTTVGHGLEEIPTHGALIVAANHPRGALDGLALLHLIGRIRPDVRLVANYVLACIPELRDLCFFVDPFDRPAAASRSLSGLRAAHLWLRRGGTLLIFPAGEVAHRRSAGGIPIDSPWRSTVGRLARSTSARILPAHIEGGNSTLFYTAGRVHPWLRTLLLSRELLNARGRSVSVRFGRVLNLSALATKDDSPPSITREIRTAAEALGRGAIIQPARPPVPLAGAIDPVLLDEDVRQLPASANLLCAGPLDVYCAEAAQIPYVLPEIGRLREAAFRAVGEGTGKSSDLDVFDRHYLHLFVWNRRTRAVVGAYRLGRTDRIVSAAGVEGLYTRTLFRFDEVLLRRLPPALELGRSFVRPEYQRDHNALLLLWKGICAFVQRHPSYRVLFGAVSISPRYRDRTRDMLVHFLEQNCLHQQAAELVSALHPYSPARPQHALAAGAPRTVEAMDRRISEFEADGRGMPVLLRQYLKLKARVLGFNVDPSFGDTLDALMMVDLLDVDPRILRRYFGVAGARRFAEYHASAPHAA